MFYAYPAPTMIAPSQATQAFGEGVLGNIVARYQGVNTNNLIPIPSTSALGSDYLYDVYRVKNSDEDQYSIMTPNVNPYLLIKCPGAETSAFAIFKPTNSPFNGDTIWTYWTGNNSLTSQIVATISADDSQMPSFLKNSIAEMMLPNDGYFCFQKTVDGGASTVNRLVYTKYFGDYELAVGTSDAFQYPWDTAAFKAAHAAEISAHNADINYWEEYIPSYEVFHQPVGARCSFWAYPEPVDPYRQLYLNGQAMKFHQTPNEYGIDFEFEGYFFYPLMYIDENNTGVFTKLEKSDDMPDFTGYAYKTDGLEYSIVDEIANGPAAKVLGTPVWKLTFNGVPFQDEIDDSRNYYVAYAQDGAMLTALIPNANQASQYYLNRPSIKNDAILWSEAKSDLSSGAIGKDTRVETFLSCGFTRLTGWDTGHPNRFVYNSLAFYSPACSAAYQTPSCPHRGNGATASEVIPSPDYDPKGGSIQLTWEGNCLSTLTHFYVEDEYSFAKQQILDGADMSLGVFQVLEMKVDKEAQ